MSFYYKLGTVQTNIPWSRPSWGSLDNWWNEYKNLPGTEFYTFSVCGGALFEINNTWDIDIAITGDIVDLDQFGKLLKDGLDLALNKYNIYVDLKWYSSLWFRQIKSNDYNSRRVYIVGELPGEEEKIRNGIQELYKKRDYEGTRLNELDNINSKYPVQFRTVIYPGEKHLNKPSDYNERKPIILEK